MISRPLRLLCLVLFCHVAAGARLNAQDFQPDLGQVLEAIDGGRALDVAIPGDAPERATYPIEVYYPRATLTEVPGKPFKQVDPAPRWPAVWMYPIYAGLGLPRDLIDALMGGISNIPILSTAGYIAYEVVPTQGLMRDPRDWHTWLGGQNKNGHGYYDGNHWGYFPSLNTWEFSYPSRYAARSNARKNQALQSELNRLNTEIEAQNMQRAEGLRTARREALSAIEAANGEEAVRRILPAREAYPQEDGVFALYVTALAQYADQNPPEWLAPVLWRELNSAQPRPLDASEKLLAQMVNRFPSAYTLGAALVYARELQGKRALGLTTAERLLTAAPTEPRRERLVFEAAMTAGNAATALPLAERLRASFAEADQAMLIARTDLLRGNFAPALELLKPLAAANPENAYYNYYLGVAQLLAGQANNDMEAFQQAFKNMESAALQAPNTALRLRAGQALAYLRGVLAGIRANPELFSDESATTGTMTF